MQQFAPLFIALTCYLHFINEIITFTYEKNFLKYLHELFFWYAKNYWRIFKILQTEKVEFLRNRRRETFSFCSFSCWGKFLCVCSIHLTQHLRHSTGSICHHLRNNSLFISPFQHRKVNQQFFSRFSLTFSVSERGWKNKMMLKNACAEVSFS